MAQVWTTPGILPAGVVCGGTEDPKALEAVTRGCPLVVLSDGIPVEQKLLEVGDLFL